MHIFPEISAYRKRFDETKYMSFLIKDDDVLEKYNEILENVKNIIKREFDSEPVYNEKNLQAKVKSYNGKINTNVHNNKIPKEGSQIICLPGKSYYPQVFLEECKSVAEEKKIPKYIIDDIEISSDSDGENSDKEYSDEENSDEENSNEENFDEEN